MGKIITNGFRLTLGEDLKLLRFEKHRLVKTKGGYMNTAISLQWCQKIHRLLAVRIFSYNPSFSYPSYHVCVRAMARNVLLQNAEIRAADSQLD